MNLKRMDTLITFVFVVFTLVTQLDQVTGHGRLMNPPARNTMWRVGFPCPVNYNDNELFCGGFVAHQVTNDGKCGLCGDNWIDSVPRAHETGGKYGVALPTRRYYSGQIITVVVELTSNHKGYFIFKVCSIIYYKMECEDQSLLNRNILPVLYPNGTLSKKYQLETEEKKATIELKLLLPAGYNCTRCCFQWTYVTGNSWGTCENGSQGMGCGKQETFINCADVSIIPMPYNYKPKPTTRYNNYFNPNLTSSPRANQYRLYYRDLSRSGAPMTALAVKFQRCVSLHGEGKTRKTPGQDAACQNRCLKYPPDCPADLCKCVKDVYATEEFRKEREMADQWCLDQCDVYPVGDCDETKCVVVYTSPR